MTAEEALAAERQIFVQERKDALALQIEYHGKLHDIQQKARQAYLALVPFLPGSSAPAPGTFTMA